MKKWKHPDDLDLVEEHKTAATSAKRWEACSGDAITTDGLTTLLSVYAGQAGRHLRDTGLAGASTQPYWAVFPAADRARRLPAGPEVNPARLAWTACLIHEYVQVA